MMFASDIMATVDIDQLLEQILNEISDQHRGENHKWFDIPHPEFDVERLMAKHEQPLRKQIVRLGLTFDQIIELRGLRTLDIGCGTESKLVKLFRSYGILAEGIDPMVPDGVDYLIKREVRALSPMTRGDIPRKDKTYFLITAHNNPGLYSLISPVYMISRKFKEIDDWLNHHIQKAKFIIDEALRVMHDEGSFIYSPSLRLLEEDIQPELSSRGYSIRNIKVDDDERLISAREQIGSKGYPTEITNSFLEDIRYRTVITRP